MKGVTLEQKKQVTMEEIIKMLDSCVESGNSISSDTIIELIKKVKDIKKYQIINAYEICDQGRSRNKYKYPKTVEEFTKIMKFLVSLEN